MPFVSAAHLDQMDYTKQDKFFASNYFIGQHHDTGDGFFVPENDRYMGTYILGVQGMGKSTLLESLIKRDIDSGNATIVIDPHGDLIDHCIAAMHPMDLPKVSVLDMEDEEYPFGINVFGNLDKLSGIDQQQVVDRVLHIFEVLWPEVMGQQYLPLYVRAATAALIANPRRTLLDMQPFLREKKLRRELLKNVSDPTIIDFIREYDDMSEDNQQRRTQALTNRLTALFMGRSLVRNIVGQREDTIDFRKAIENKEFIFIKLPMNKIPYDAQVIALLLIAQINNAVFSFADRPANKRPGVSIYVDEFQNFCTSDFSKLFTEGRKYGCRITLAHQHREQLPDYLKSSTQTAYTKICFRSNASDAREMAHYFYSDFAYVRQKDIEEKVSKYLIDHPSDSHEVREFTARYLRPLLSKRREDRRADGRIEIEYPGLNIWTMFAKASPNPYVDDPTPYLDALLQDVMRNRRPTLPVPHPVAFGFSGCGWGFYRKLMNMRADDRQQFLSSSVGFPDHLTEYDKYGKLRWIRKPEDSYEEMWCFIFHLRMTMLYLADNPIGDETVMNTTDLAHILTQLPKGMVLIRSGDDVGQVETQKPGKGMDMRSFGTRMKELRDQTRQRYTKPRSEIESMNENLKSVDVEPDDVNEMPVKPQSIWEDVE